MANIDKELKAIMDAVYGEEVRGSIHDALKAGNDEINRYGLQESARVAAEQARAQAESARVTAENARAGAETSRETAELLRQQGETARQQATQAAVTAAENAATVANEAADRANAVADEDISDKQVQFAEAAEKSEIESGDTLGTICGKVKKSFAEMDGEIAKVNGDIGDVNDLEITGKNNIVEAVNDLTRKVGGESPYTIFAMNVSDLNNPPYAFILQTSPNPAGMPDIGSNSCLVIQQNPGSVWLGQFAFSYNGSKMAIRGKQNGVWTEWKYITAM